MSDTTVGDLTPRHIGRSVTITTKDAQIAGVLRDLRVDTDWITEATAERHPDDWDQTPGRRTASLTVGRWTATDVPLGAEVVVFDE